MVNKNIGLGKIPPPYVFYVNICLYNCKLVKRKEVTIMLNERQKKECELYAEGETITNIAKICNTSRQTVYEDMKRDEWKANLDELVTEIKVQGEKKIMSKVDKYIGELDKIAMTSKSENTKKDVLMYLLNRIYGSPTNKNQDITDNKDDNNIDKDTLQNDFNKFKLRKVE